MMKKIIELAEKAIEVFDHPFDEYLNSINDLKMGLAHRKLVEATPITEDWLKEHGCEFDYTIEEAVADYHWVTCNGYIKKGEGYLLNWCNGILKISNDFENSEFSKYGATLADLLDACELCGITMN